MRGGSTGRDSSVGSVSRSPRHVRPWRLFVAGAVLVGAIVKARFAMDHSQLRIAARPCHPSRPWGVPPLRYRWSAPSETNCPAAYQLRLATSEQAGEVGRLVASVYNAETGERVSSADKWAEVDGELYAVSSSAVDLSALPPLDRSEFDPFFDPTRNDLERCAIDAMTGQVFLIRERAEAGPSPLAKDVGAVVRERCSLGRHFVAQVDQLGDRRARYVAHERPNLSPTPSLPGVTDDGLPVVGVIGAQLDDHEVDEVLQSWAHSRSANGQVKC